MRLKLKFSRAALAILVAALPAKGVEGQAVPDPHDVILATTTSLRDTGLLDSLLPVFERETGFHVRAIAVGSGQALRMGERGDADVILAHAPVAEEDYMRAGHGTSRQVVAWNWFVIAGPPGDPAGVAAAASAPDALRRIAAAGLPFISRGDSSGTHLRELALWRAAGGRPRWRGYAQTGQGMGTTLLVADERRGYTLSDAATLQAFRDRVDLVALRGAEPALLNVYHVIEVSPAGHPRVNVVGARAFAAWITSPQGQDVIAAFRRGTGGAPLFVAARGREPAR
jgi:tungstate transport system substrate-binding protein